MRLEEKLNSEKVKKALDFTPHPNLIIGVKVDNSITEGGVIKPDTAEDKTPVMEIIAIGDNIADNNEWLEVGNHCYVMPHWVNGRGSINGVEMYFMPPDAILGVKQPKLEEVN